MLKEQESGQRTADICRRHGISEAIFYEYKAKYDGPDISNACKVKKLLAEPTLDDVILNDVASKEWRRPAQGEMLRPSAAASAIHWPTVIVLQLS